VLFSRVDVILFLEESLVCMISFFSSAVKDLHVYPGPEGMMPYLTHTLQLALLLSEWVTESDTQERILCGQTCLWEELGCCCCLAISFPVH